jgi:hypothetical protein
MKKETGIKKHYITYYIKRKMKTYVSPSAPTRGFYVDDNGDLRPNLDEQRINLYIRSLFQWIRDRNVVVSTLHRNGVINSRSKDGSWTTYSIKKCIDSTYRFGHLWYDQEPSPEFYLMRVKEPTLYSEWHPPISSTSHDMGNFRHESLRRSCHYNRKPQTSLKTPEHRESMSWAVHTLH